MAKAGTFDEGEDFDGIPPLPIYYYSTRARMHPQLAAAMSAGAPAPPPEPEATRAKAAAEKPTVPDFEHEYTPDDVLRVFQWFQTGPAPLAVEVHNLRNAHLALGIDVSNGQLMAALASTTCAERAA